MSAGGLLLLTVTLLAGSVAAGAVRCDLTVVERAALAVVLGILGTTAAALVLGTFLGVHPLTAVLGAGCLGAAAALPARWRTGPGPLAVWRADVASVRTALHAGDRTAVREAALAATAGVVAALLLRHALIEQDGALVSSYATVWADWSLHSTLVSSFAHAQNLPPHDPIFAGGTLRYPFLADLHAAFQQSAGDGIGASMAVGSGLLASAAVVMVGALGRRLAGSLAVGAIAALLCVGGGSLGWTGVWWDACHASGRVDADCGVGSVLVHPDAAISVLRAVPSVAATQPRAYDNLQNDASVAVGNVQWYTPLLAWWLPQRTFVAGFAVGTAVLLLLVAARRAPPGTRSPYAAAGLLLGLLPLVHIHTLIALTVVIALLALGWRRREWWWMVGAAVLLALPRLVQVAGGGSGRPDTCAGGTPGGGGTGRAFPFLEPGWLAATPHAFDPALCAVPGRYALTPLGVIRAVPAILGTVLDPRWWGFWIMNNGAVFLVVVAAAATAVAAVVLAGFAPARAAALRARALALVPGDLVRLAFGLLAVFVIANVVVTQTWDWDNTKLLAWSYLGGALLTGALLVRLARSSWVGMVATVAVLGTLLGSGGLQLLRIARDPATPYTWASADDRALAAHVDAITAHDAVFLTAGDPTDPVLTIAGRTALAGYAGWLYSYGVDEGDRPAAIAEMLAGCDQVTASCRVPDLLRTWRVDYVEVCSDGADARCAGAAWYARRYPLVAASGARSVYDVRRP